MVSAAQLRDRVAAEYPDATQVGETVVRFVRSARNRPYAVCYLDVSEKIPDSKESLIQYQDEVIGRHYFEGRKSLQWSNYLYFVTTAERLTTKAVRSAKDLIEADRSYARKFVISEAELDEVLVPPIVRATGDQEKPNILANWTRRLMDANLESAILSDDDLPGRIDKILAATNTTPKSKLPRRRGAERKPPPPFIRNLKINEFRRYPLKTDFKFGTVNLIFGPNASGKTSLLEAIEVFYCGLNRRSKGKTCPHDLLAVLADGKTETAKSPRDRNVSRARNLEWYGRPEIKTNTLCDSFTLFNFLDTDAAVRIADSTSTIKDDLSKLLIGADASQVWDTINRVHEELRRKLNDQQKFEKTLDDEHKAIESLLKAAGGVRKESDALFEKLSEMMKRLRWDAPKSNAREKSAAEIVSFLSELTSLTEQAAALEWAGSPVSLTNLTAYSNEADTLIKKADPLVVQLDSLITARRRLESAAVQIKEAQALANDAKQLIEAGIPERAEEATKIRDTIATLNGLLAGRLPATSETTLTPSAESVLFRYQRAQADRIKAEQALELSKSEYTRLASIREQSLNLGQQLRRIAAEILKTSPKPDECPLCHTHFEPGELAAHMALGIDAHAESAGQAILDRTRIEESTLRATVSLERAYSWLKDFSNRCGLPSETSVSAALKQLDETTHALTEAENRRDRLTEEQQTLEAKGLSYAAFQAISSRLTELGYPLSDTKREAASKVLAAVESARSGSDARLKDSAEQIDAQQTALQDLLRTSGRAIADFRAAVSRLKERVATTRILLSKLAPFSRLYSWPAASPLAELAVEAKSVGSLAAQLQTTLAREKQEQATHAQSTKRKEKLERDLTELRGKLKRFTEAKDTLEKLINEESMTTAMEAALTQNHSAIESIFSRIHAPAEFSHLGSSFDTFKRKDDNSDANLSQISTGQRAAFALSIFLAQNAQLVSAPRVMLIDDPIAHVDDLNSLSFLDYLREVSLKGNRQIFFATANDKIASLFERKFDFLGDEFQKIVLTREQAA